MKKIKEKLHSEEGASFLLALVAFLVAAMVAVTIVTAAVSSLKRVYSDREEQQARLTLTSAAQLVREEMKKTSVTKTVVGESDETITGDGIFHKEMQEAVKYVDTYASLYNGSGIRLEVQGMEMKPVNVSFTMKSEAEEIYKVIFTFTLADSGETLFLTMDGVDETKSETSTDGNGAIIKTTTTKITWNQPMINGIGG